MSRLWGWVLGIGTLLAALGIWWSKRNAVSDLRTALEVQRIRQHSRQTEQLLAELEREGDAHARERQVLTLGIADARRRAVALGSELSDEAVQEMSNAEIAAVFTRLGF